MITIAVSNQKGGVGKTTTSVHLAVGLARRGWRTCLLDADTQSHSTAWVVGDEWPDSCATSFEALTRGKLTGRDLVASDLAPNLWALPAIPDQLATTEAALSNKVGREKLLAQSLKDLTELDFCIIDCAPNLGIAVTAALCASDYVLSPVTPSYLSLEGLSAQAQVMESAREMLGARVQLLGYLLFGTDKREALPALARKRLSSSGLVLESEIRLSTAAKYLPDGRKTAWDAGQDPRGAEDYDAALKEILKKLGMSNRPEKKERAHG